MEDDVRVQPDVQIWIWEGLDFNSVELQLMHHAQCAEGKIRAD